jgi:hypothetical protein
MAKKPPVHVTPHDKGWAVTREGSKRAASVHRTQQEAAKEGKATVARDKTEYFLHGKDGQIRERNTSGKNPYPPKG